MNRLKKFWSWLSGNHVCTDFTKWEDCTREVSRPVRITECFADPTLTTIQYTSRCQERKCVNCGKIQQRELKI